jgi:SWI/SNF-related matrix-associated actin-dependent regulator of chromatin subfamily A member 5
MLDRLRRKLFLSVKVMGAENYSAGSDNSTLKAKELMDILRKGSSALSRSDDGIDFSRFLNAGIEEILNASRTHENMRDAKVKQELSVGDVEDEALLRDAEAEELKLLSGVAQVQSRLFEGQMVQPCTNKDIATEWKNLQKRARVDRTVVIDGITVIAAHVGPEAVSRSICGAIAS